MDRGTVRWMNGWTDGWTDQWMDGWNGRSGRWKNKLMGGWIDRWKEGGRSKERTDGWVGGWVDGNIEWMIYVWMDKFVYVTIRRLRKALQSHGKKHRCLDVLWNGAGNAPQATLLEIVKAYILKVHTVGLHVLWPVLSVTSHEYHSYWSKSTKIS